MTFSDVSASQASADSRAVSLVVGASGGVGAALVAALQARGETVWAWSRAGDPPVDITDEASVRAAAALLQAQLLADGRTLRRVWVATGVLHGQTPDGGAMAPERSWRDIRPEALLRQFEVNALGPMLLLKHLLPLLPKRAPSWVACLSARVGSVGDNRLGGWYSYRASKAALNQLVHTAAIELARSHPQAVVVSLHPGHVATGLSAAFGGNLPSVSPEVAAGNLLDVLSALTPAQTGGFFDWAGKPIVW